MLILNLLFGFSILLILSVVVKKFYKYYTKDKIIDKFNNDLKIAEKQMQSYENELIREIDSAVKKHQLENKKQIQENNKKDYLSNPENWIKVVEEIPTVILENGMRIGGNREFYIKNNSETYRKYQSGLSVDLYWSDDVISHYDISSNQ